MDNLLAWLSIIVPASLLLPYFYITVRLISKAWHKSKFEEVKYHG